MIRPQILISVVITLLFLASCDTANDQGEAPLQKNIPSVVLTTAGVAILDDPKIDAQIEILVDDKTEFEGNVAIEIRGSTSQQFPKDSYIFETRDANNEDIDVSFLGLPEEEDWILQGPYTDKTLIRNKFIYDLSRSMGNYASRTVFVDLILNEEYRGLYVLMEKLKRDDNRIDISKLNPDENSGEDLTGGYLLKIDRAVENEPTASFTSSYPPPFATRNQEVTFVFEEPAFDDITTQQRNYITEYIFSFEDALNAERFKDPISGYLPFINVSSFIDYFLINELANNADAYRLSTYMHKDKNGKLNMGPVWDFNYALGNVDFCNAGQTNVWAYKFNERCGNHNQQVPFWWSRLLEDEAFVNQLQERWANLRNDEFSEANLHEMINSYVALLNDSGAAERNFVVWDILGVDIHPNNFVGETYEQEITYLKDWISDRLLWLDSSILEL